VGELTSTHKKCPSGFTYDFTNRKNVGPEGVRGYRV
jgi:hypothetical protein